MNKKYSSIVAICIIGIGSYLFFIQPAIDKKSYPQLVSSDIVEKDEQSGMHVYTHPRYGFTLSYKDDLQVQRIQEGSASETITFAAPDISLMKGFQVFVTPYAETVITPKRLQQDIPSGDVREQVEVILGKDLRAMAFKTNMPPLGEVREVWLIHDGFIYEFTAPIVFDAWLSGILATIEFNTE